MKKHQEAQKITESALSLVGRNLQLEIQLAVLQEYLGELTAAIETLQRSLAYWPDNLIVLNSLYRLTGKTGNKTEAKHFFKRYMSQKIRQNPHYTSEIVQLFESVKVKSDKHNLWALIDADINEFFYQKS